jgi:2-oxoglutarate ferredoxin oxidoreductase subunit alpha
MHEEFQCEDADYIIVAFGSSARISQKTVQLARAKGIKVGLIRPITLWPYPSEAIAKYADQVKGFLSVEMNAGQMVEDVRLAANGKAPVEHYGRMGGMIASPSEVLDALEQKLIK